jgi:hypothetical protein
VCESERECVRVHARECACVREREREYGCFCVGRQACMSKKKQQRYVGVEGVGLAPGLA